jgi:hypothetical protein
LSTSGEQKRRSSLSSSGGAGGVAAVLGFGEAGLGQVVLERVVEAVRVHPLEQLEVFLVQLDGFAAPLARLVL